MLLISILKFAGIILGISAGTSIVLSIMAMQEIMSTKPHLILDDMGELARVFFEKYRSFPLILRMFCYPGKSLLLFIGFLFDL